MSEFKVGDRVRIREDLKRGFEEDGWGVCESMLKYRGKTAIIKEVYSYFYEIDIDEEENGWTDGMLELVEKSQEPPTLEELEQRIEKLEKCFMGEKNLLEKCVNVSLMSEFTKEEIESFNYWKDENYKWVCKDEDGTIHIFKIKPTIYNIEELLKVECGNEN